MRRLVFILFTVACTGKDSLNTDSGIDSEIDSQGGTDSGPVETPVDEDDDGYTVEEDCDDQDAAINPGAQELCSGVDEDCDGEIDEAGAVGETTAYVDQDGDGWGIDEGAITACTLPSGYASQSGDCADQDPKFHPGAEELDCTDPNDYNCDGSVGYSDNDGDGFAACEECDDSDGTVSPSAEEICDQRDNDCDGLTDDGDDSLNLGTAVTWYADSDGDGFGDPDYSSAACEQPSGYSADSSDCKDSDSAINPDASEVCDDQDNDCDTLVDFDDDSLDPSSGGTWYSDSDNDGYGDASAPVTACDQPSGAVSDTSDCDDSDSAINPGASEVCKDSTDNNCDGLTDDSTSVDATTYYADTDNDGYGDPSVTQLACSRPSGYRGNKKDCDDSDSSISPVATEVCDSVDNNCDGSVDNSASDALTWYKDADSDGWGLSASTTQSCTQPSGYAADTEDCDDGDATINPDAEDICDGQDNDCDTVTDPTGVDSDGDGTYNCIDSSVYSENFDDGSWTGSSSVDLGGGNSPSWSISSGRLGERSNAAQTIYYGPDMGELDTYTVSVDMYPNGTSSSGGINDGGLVFAFEDKSNYWIARWRDPNDYYKTYSSKGRIDLYRCHMGTCAVEATDDGSRNLSRTASWTTMSVTVSGEYITVVWDGYTIISAYNAGYSPVGINAIGVYSYDNDSGFYYDNLKVTNP